MNFPDLLFISKNPLIVALATGLAACGSTDANAENQQAEAQNRTMAECRVLTDRNEKLACMQDARAAADEARDSEIAALDDQLEQGRKTITVLTELQEEAFSDENSDDS